MNSPQQIHQQPAAGQDDALAGLREILQVTRPDADNDLIRRAYDVAASWHHGQARLSGDPYITHPLAVATILAELSAWCPAVSPPRGLLSLAGSPPDADPDGARA